MEVKRTWKRAIALMLALVMAFTFVPSVPAKALPASDTYTYTCGETFSTAVTVSYNYAYDPDGAASIQWKGPNDDDFFSSLRYDGLSVQIISGTDYKVSNIILSGDGTTPEGTYDWQVKQTIGTGDEIVASGSITIKPQPINLTEFGQVRIGDGSVDRYFTYDGTFVEPEITVYHTYGYGNENGTLIDESAYDILYIKDDGSEYGSDSQRALSVGTYRVVAIANDNDNYVGAAISTGRFTVEQGKATITVKDNITQAYDPDFTTRIEGADNVAKYVTSDLKGDDVITAITLKPGSTDVGETTLEVSDAKIERTTGVAQPVDVTGNYEIEYKSGSITITKAEIEITEPTDPQNPDNPDYKETVDYDGSEHKPTNLPAVTAPAEAVIQYRNDEDGTYSTTVPGFTNGGTHTITYKAVQTGNSNYEAESAEKTFDFEIKSLGDQIPATINLNGWTYGDVLKAEEIFAANNSENLGKLNVTGIKVVKSDNDTAPSNDEFDNSNLSYTSLEGLKTLDAGKYWIKITANSSNYATTTFDAIKVTVSKRPVVIVIKDVDYTVGNADPELSFDVKLADADGNATKTEGLVGTDTAAAAISEKAVVANLKADYTTKVVTFKENLEPVANSNYDLKDCTNGIINLTKVDLSDATVKFNVNETEFVFSGSSQTPTIESVELGQWVYDDEQTDDAHKLQAIQGEYNITYTRKGDAEEIAADTIKNKGEYTMHITAADESKFVKGKKDIDFEIAEKLITIKVIAPAQDYKYGSNEVNFENDQAVVVYEGPEKDENKKTDIDTWEEVLNTYIDAVADKSVTYDKDSKDDSGKFPVVTEGCYVLKDAYVDDYNNYGLKIESDPITINPIDINPTLQVKESWAYGKYDSSNKVKLTRLSATDAALEADNNGKVKFAICSYDSDTPISGYDALEEGKLVEVFNKLTVGDYKIIATVGAVEGKYNAGTASATFHVYPQPIHVKIESKNVKYLQDIPELTYEVYDSSNKKIENIPADMFEGKPAVSLLYTTNAGMPGIYAIVKNNLSLKAEYADRYTLSNNVADGTLTVEAINLADEKEIKMSLDATKHTYDGNAFKPEIESLNYTVDDKEKDILGVLVEGRDYYAAYQMQNKETKSWEACDNPVEAGNYRLLIGTPTKGTALKNSTYVEFEITKVPIAVTYSAESKTYDGKTEVTVSPKSVTINGESAKFDDLKALLGVDVKLPTTGTVDNANAGNDKKVNVDLSAFEFDNYEIVLAKEFTVNITPAVIAEKDVTLDKKEFTYNGNVQKPEVTVTVNNKKLTADTDYTVTYSNANSQNVGEYTVTVTGKGNYKTNSAIKLNYTIVKKDVTVTSTLKLTDKVYDGNATMEVTGSVTANGLVASDGTKLTGADAKSVTVSSADVGDKSYTFTLSLTGDAAKNYTLKTTSVTATGKINEKEEPVVEPEKPEEPVVETKKPEDLDEGELVAENDGLHFYLQDNGDVTCYTANDKEVYRGFATDGTYTYFFQYDGTAMRDRLTYHPDGEHVIYFDENGHEIFNDYAHVKRSIAGEEVDDYCFFDVFGYMYVDVITWDQTGTKLLYANPYGVLEVGKWFQFSDTVKWADGTECDGIAGGYGYAMEDATLMRDQYTYDWEGRFCYMQGNGVALY
ncbi:MAG: hypothetical protein IJ141_07885 [Lachnospiraceae bacterium]|nr:hypothetical protein [Lachnospiraceae bacterium]